MPDSAPDTHGLQDPADPPVTAAPCPKGRTDYEACFAPFRYCPEKGCGRAEGSKEPTPRSHWPECLSLTPEPVYDDGTPNPCDCRIWSLIKSRENPEAADRLLAAIERLGLPDAT